MNNTIFPTVADVLTYLKGLKRQNLIGTCFGSYGWSGEATKQLAQMLEDMKVEMAAEPVRALYVPDDADLARCYEAGKVIGEKLQANCECGCEAR